jgi:hypothetical protein
MALSRVQRRSIYAIFETLRIGYSRGGEIEPSRIVDILSNPDGTWKELPTLDRVADFKTDPVSYMDTGRKGNAEDVFREVARVISLPGAPSKWTVKQKYAPNPSNPDYHELISEHFSWTSGGIVYKVKSDWGDNWYFKGMVV